MCLWTPAERASLAFLAWMVLLLLPFGPDPWARRWLVGDLMLVAALCALARVQWRLRPLFTLWVVLPLAYFQAGNFGTRWRASVEPALIWIDRHWFGLDWYARHLAPPSFWSGVLEAAYLANYLLVFAWVTAVVLMAFLPRHAARAARPQSAPPSRPAPLLVSVLGALITALLACYALFPLLPAVTPRLFFPALRETDPAGFLRALNHLLLDRGSVPWGILPSGHMAGPVAMGAVFVYRRRWFWAAVYLGSSVLIGFAIVHGNYHFVADGVAGALVGLLAAVAVEVQLRRATRVAARSEATSATMASLG